MGSLFNKNKQVQQRSQREILASRYYSARHDMLWIMICTLINIVLLVTNSGRYFLFSAYIPYMLIDCGMYFCGLYPAEHYGPYYSGMEFLNISFMIICAIIAVVVLLMYLVSWLFAKKPRVGWMIFALIFFTIDTVVLLVMMGFSNSVFDLLLHGWFIFSMTRAVVSYFKLKKLPAEPEPDPIPEEVIEPEQEIVE